MTNDQPKALIIGAGSDDLQQGGELDYATLEVGRTLQKAGFKTSLIDDNPFSTSLDTHKSITERYILPLTAQSIIEVINRSHPQLIVPTLGGRRAFELLQTVSESGILTERDIQIAGIPESTVRQVNNPVLLNQTLRRLHAPTKKIATVDNYQAALEIAQEVGFPVVVRAVFPKSLRMRRIVQDGEELRKAVSRGIQMSRSGQVMVQQSLAGLKEIEVLVMRDASGNMMSLGMAEDIDPIGIHAGDSMTVLPAQTLLDRNIQDMRNTAFAITRKLRIVGVNHVQFAFDAHQNRYYVIKDSPYFDRISTFVEMATGYPVSRVVGHLYAGELLRNIRLDHGLMKHTAVTEPVMDRTAVRMPIFPFSQLSVNNQKLGTQKKSVGSTIGIGRSLIEAILKAIADYQFGWHNGQAKLMQNISDDQLDQLLIHPHGDALYSLVEAIRRGYSEKELAELTKIDRYYLAQLNRLLKIQQEIQQLKSSPAVLKEAKYWGFSDAKIAELWNTDAEHVYKMRDQHHINRTFKEVDPSAGEFDQHSHAFFSTFELENESQDDASQTILVVGSGPRRLGNGNANDYVVSRVMNELRSHGLRIVLINDNPSSPTMSGLFADKRYIEPLTIETVMDIVRIEKPGKVMIASNEGELYERLQKQLPETIGLQAIPTEDQLEDVVSNEPLLEYNALFDGQYVYPLGMTAALQADDQLNYRTIAKRYPTTLSPTGVKNVMKLGEQAVRNLTTPGLYQVLIDSDPFGSYRVEMVRALPATDIAFLSKVLQLDLSAVIARLAVNKFSGKLLQQSMEKQPDHQRTAVYRALFPFKALQINEQPTALKVMGAEMQFIE
ncbi:ATP-grasp domain-containing protein [uncultured Limosilactobacillus sp.]|uniref:carbamoyl phosphate synthase preATP-grasp domain-containing protein n=1 Tax=uncultured Limosilactobacillus sp. TaxID=2837629 RepID=UPI0025FA31DD|nr:ATP-grasp domain-containing protein [uncultured Limosilactobacillus sp.]